MKKRMLFFGVFVSALNSFSQNSGSVSWNGKYSCCGGTYITESLPDYNGSTNKFGNNFFGPVLTSFTINYTFTQTNNSVILNTSLAVSSFDNKIIYDNGGASAGFQLFTSQRPQLNGTRVQVNCEVYYNGALIDIPGYKSISCGGNKVVAFDQATADKFPVAKQARDNKYSGTWEIRNLGSIVSGVENDDTKLSNCPSIKDDFVRYIEDKKNRERAQKLADVERKKQEQAKAQPQTQGQSQEKSQDQSKPNPYQSETKSNNYPGTSGNVNTNNQQPVSDQNAKIIAHNNELLRQKQQSKENYERQLEQSKQIEDFGRNASNAIDNALGIQGNNQPDNTYDPSVLAKKSSLEGQLSEISGYDQSSADYNQQLINESAAILADVITGWANDIDAANQEYKRVKNKIMSYELKRSKSIELANLMLMTEKKVFLQKALISGSCKDFIFDDLFSDEIVPEDYKTSSGFPSRYDEKKREQRKKFINLAWSGWAMASKDSSFYANDWGKLFYKGIQITPVSQIRMVSSFSRDNNSILWITSDYLKELNKMDFISIGVLDIKHLDKTKINSKKEIWDTSFIKGFIIKNHKSPEFIQFSPNCRYAYRKYYLNRFLYKLNYKDSEWKYTNWLSSNYSQNDNKVHPLSYFTLEYIDFKNYHLNEKGYHESNFLSFSAPDLLNFEFIPNSDDSVLVLTEEGSLYKAQFPSGNQNQNEICKDQIDIKVADNLTNKSWLNHKLAFSDDSRYFLCLATASPKNWQLMDATAASKLYLFDYKNFRLISELPVSFHLVLDADFYKGNLVVYGLDEYDVFIQKIYDPDKIAKEVTGNRLNYVSTSVGHPKNAENFTKEPQLQISDCEEYCTKSILDFRNRNSINTGNILVVNDTENEVDVNLYHSDGPGSKFMSLHLLPGESRYFLYNGSRFNIGGDWGVQLIDFDSKISCVFFVANTCKFSNSYYTFTCSSVSVRK
ncbi:MAG: hypothetical protein NTU98_02815 [Bacteroidetes bacterium]|nr:hypothetical protein [Bacteroidota bacterium]